MNAAALMAAALMGLACLPVAFGNNMAPTSVTSIGDFAFKGTNDDNACRWSKESITVLDRSPCFVSSPARDMNMCMEGGAYTMIVEGNGIYIALNPASGFILRSTDGVTWERQHRTGIPSQGNYRVNSLAFGNGVFLASGTRGASSPLSMMTSVDGLTWTAVTEGFHKVQYKWVQDDDFPTKAEEEPYGEAEVMMAGGWSGMAFGDGKFVAMQNTESNIHPYPLRSTGFSGTREMTTWYETKWGRETEYVNITGPGVITSPDGIHWTPRFTGHSGSPGDGGLMFLNNHFIAITKVVMRGNPVVVTPAAVLMSKDGLTWSKTVLPSCVEFGVTPFTRFGPPSTGECAGDKMWGGITYGNGLYVAVGMSKTGNVNNVMSSPDAITWTLHDNQFNAHFGSIAYGSGYFLAVLDGNHLSDSFFLASKNGKTWTYVDTGGDKIGRMIYYGTKDQTFYTNGNAYSGYPWEHPDRDMLDQFTVRALKFTDPSNPAADDATKCQAWTQGTSAQVAPTTSALTSSPTSALTSSPTSAQVVAIAAAPAAAVAVAPTPTNSCVHEDCKDWGCDNWCECFDETKAAVYTRLGCDTVDDAPCQC